VLASCPFSNRPTRICGNARATTSCTQR
jgi:hypothetical protein